MEGLVAPSKLYGILAAGRPVAAICESHSYLRQMLSEVNFGKAFNNGDSEGLAQFIRELATHREKSELMGRQGRRYLETHFTPEHIAQQYGEVLTVDPEWKSKVNMGRLVKFKEF
jgi:glycosyltransferase involved in cell wall biosynthesis